MRKYLFGVLASFLLVSTVHAAKMHGVEVLDSLTVGEQTLSLNGVGIRKKGPFKVYLAALYTPEKTSQLESLLAQEGAKRVQLNMLRNIAKNKMVSAIVSGFKANTANIASIQARIDEFISYMENTKKGDTIQFDYLPASGTNIIINGNTKGTIVGKDFFDALLKVWVGDKPADRRLKNSMLGL